MELKNIFKASAIVSALVLAGCGGDINITPTVNDTSVNNSNNTTTTTVEGGNGNGSTENPCASYDADGVTMQGEFTGGNCEYSKEFVSPSNPLAVDLSLDKLEGTGVHFFKSSLVVGENCNTSDNCTIVTDGPTLSIEAGTTLVFDDASSRVQINRGANIEATGTYSAPITFTSANAIASLKVSDPQPQDWGGIMIDGLGITDQCSDAERTAGTCNAESEGAVTFYGGNDNTDNSGTLKFVKIHFAGGLPAGAEEGDDLNSLSLFAVGSGTTIDYVDIYAGYDDGIELFGGAVNLKHVVVTDTQDDSIDIDAGWKGNAQFILIKHGTVVNAAGNSINMGNGGFESDGTKVKDNNVAPSAPQIANVTVLTTDEESVRDGNPSAAIKLDDFISATWYNTLLVKTSGTQTHCFENSADAVAVVESGDVSMKNSVMACAVLGKAETVGTTTYTNWLTDDAADMNTITGGDADVLSSNGFATIADLKTPFDVTTIDANFFESVDYIGAVSPTDTSSDWYDWAKDAYDNAIADEQ
ncbi:hypothetical protein RS130_10415 [Paraglaciecola aquimarina]|uniref:Serine/threonine protein kinase n=1 Tax=Paraglaciecola aquimarina TaxID=1235557 RepID=A0ABU3SWB9_9ALTE|nr:hypothetical protein [Paraglaciecola aquimarina]MDU0354288.1 hypothetical protein [Paraglaciecola aquimarina]